MTYLSLWALMSRLEINQPCFWGWCCFYLLLLVLEEVYCNKICGQGTGRFPSIEEGNLNGVWNRGLYDSQSSVRSHGISPWGTFRKSYVAVWFLLRTGIFRYYVFGINGERWSFFIRGVSTPFEPNVGSRPKEIIGISSIVKSDYISFKAINVGQFFSFLIILAVKFKIN